MANISVVTITKNSANRIKEVVRNALQLGGEHIVVDTGSQDKTREIAARSGARVLEYRGEFDYSTPRNLGASNAANDWILQLDDDESILAPHIPVIHNAVESGKSTCYDFKQVRVYGGHQKPEPVFVQSRLYDRRSRRFEGLVYEWVYPLKNSLHIEAHLRHEMQCKNRPANADHRRALVVQEAENILGAPVDTITRCEFVYDRLRHLVCISPQDLATKIRTFMIEDRTEVWSPEVLFRLGYFLFDRQREIDEANFGVRLMNDSLVRDATDYQANYIGGIAATMVGQYEDGIKHLSHALELHESSETHHLLGLIYQYRGEHTRARAHLRRACELDPEDINTKEALSFIG